MASEKRYLIEETINIKSKLIDVLRRLEREPRATVAARELGAIIGRLEHWQNKHTKG